MRIITLDLDGVIIEDPLGLTRNPLLGSILNTYFLGTKLGKRWYLKRKVNSRVAKIVQNRKNRGEKVIIISATFEKHRLLVESWLAFHSFPYDLLCLRQEKEELISFKLRALSKFQPSIYLEDNLAIVKKIMTSFPSARFKKWGKRIFVVKLKFNKRRWKMVTREDIGKWVRTSGGIGVLRDVEGGKAIVELDFMYLVAFPLKEVGVEKEGHVPAK